MNKTDHKETVLAYVKQYETDAAVGMTPDRSRRTLLRRLGGRADARRAYNELLSDGSIHEMTASTGSVMVVYGPAPKKAAQPLPFPYNQIDPAVVQAFCIRMISFGISDVKVEISKALEQYVPEQP